METPFPFPIPFWPGGEPAGDRVYRTPTGEPLNEPGQPINPAIFLPVAPPPPAPTPTPTPTPAPAPPISPPVATPSPTPAPSPGPASGGTSPESYRGQVERVMRDTAKRRGAARVAEKVLEGEILRRGAGAIGRAILGPIGAIFGAAIPSELGSGEVSPDELERNRARERERQIEEESIISEIGRDIFRGGAIGGAGIVIGGGVIVDELLKRGLPRTIPLPDDVGDEPPVSVEVPRVDIPASVISQPSPLPLPTPPTSPLPMPSPPPSSSRSPRTSSIPRAARLPAPAASVLTQPWPLLGLLTGSQTRRSALTRPRTALFTEPGAAIATQPATSVSLISPTSALPTTADLTGFQAQVLGSSPPRIGTRTRTRECQCEPKRKKPARKCRARAPVKWAGGPKIGQLAGTRCISFER